MLSQNQARFVASLQVKKYRQKYRQFTVEGEKMARELLGQSRVRAAAVFCRNEFLEENAALLAPHSQIVHLVSEPELKKISALTTPNQVLVVADLPDELPDFQALATNFFFYLDGLQDPGNLGAILRIADWFGFGGVFCSPDSVDVWNPKTVQASMGAVLRVPVFEMPLAEIFGEKNPPGFSLALLGAVLDGENVFAGELPKAGLLAIGNEGRGLSPETESRLTHRLTIPRDPRGGAESLNASVAAGILAGALRFGGRG